MTLFFNTICAINFIFSYYVYLKNTFHELKTFCINGFKLIINSNINDNFSLFKKFNIKKTLA